MARAAVGGTLDAGMQGLITLGLHHEQQHQELLLTDIKHALSFGATSPPGTADGTAYAKHWPIGAVQAQPLRWFA